MVYKLPLSRVYLLIRVCMEKRVLQQIYCLPKLEDKRPSIYYYEYSCNTMDVQHPLIMFDRFLCKITSHSLSSASVYIMHLYFLLLSCLHLITLSRAPVKRVIAIEIQDEHEFKTLIENAKEHKYQLG